MSTLRIHRSRKPSSIRFAMLGLVSVGLLVANASVAQSVPGDESWVLRYGSGLPESWNVDVGKAVEVAADGTVYVAGTSQAGLDATTWHTTMTLIAYSSLGDGLWVRNFPDEAQRNGSVNDLAVSPDGRRIVVAGEVDAEYGSNLATIAYDSEGTQLWVREYDSPMWSGSGTQDLATAIAMDPEGRRVFVTGMSAGEKWGSTDFATVAYGMDGRRLWVRRYTSPLISSDDRPTAVAVSPDGRKVYVTGRSERPTRGQDVTTLAYSARDGRQHWVRHFDVATDSGRAIAVGPSGARVYIGGGISEPGSKDMLVLAYRADGTLAWSRRYDGVAADDPGYNLTSMALAPNGQRIYLAGWCCGSNSDVVTVAYDQDGTRRWADTFDGIDNARATSVVAGSRTGELYVTGYEWGTNVRWRYLTLGYTDQSRAWVRRYDGPTGATGTQYASQARALAVSPDGSQVIVTGFTRLTDSSSTSVNEFVTVAYLTD